MSEKEKPLGQKSYGHIAHVPGSRIGPGDHKVPLGMAKIVCEETRDRHDHIIVQVKVDGSNVSIANVDGEIVPLGRSGYRSYSSPWRQHHIFADWVYGQLERFEFLKPGERLCGEWMAQAHGTRYSLPHEPFIAFDIMTIPHKRATYDELIQRVTPYDFVTPHLLSEGPPRSIEWCKNAISNISPHGEIDRVEGVVWRCERRGEVDFLCKWVHPDKEDGIYLPSKTDGGEVIWNWSPEGKREIIDVSESLGYNKWRSSIFVAGEKKNGKG